MARTFQVTSLFPKLTVLDNVLLAIKGLRPSKFVMWRFLSSYKEVYDKAHRLLEEAGFLDRKDIEVRNLSHGEQRQLEIVLGLASDPKILLLDEPAAGLSSGESTEMAKFLMKLDPESGDPADRARHGRGVRRRRRRFRCCTSAKFWKPARPSKFMTAPACRKSIWGPAEPWRSSKSRTFILITATPTSSRACRSTRARPDPRPARPQRRRQDHAGEFDRRLQSAAPRQDRVQRRRHHAEGLVRDRAQRHGPGAAGPPRISDARRRGEPAGRRAQPRPPWLESRPRLQAVSAPARAPQSARQDAVRRRAADAGDRPRADDQPRLPDHGRAVGGPGADHHPGPVGSDRQARRRKACRFCWSSRTRILRSSWSTTCT